MIIQDNPFHKPNPFKLVQYQKFEHPYLHSQKNQDHQHLVYHTHIRPHQNKILQNNWTFNEDNLSKKHDFSKRQDLNSSNVSQFQMKMKMANIGVPHHRNHNKVVEGKLQNPFYRKNLLFNKEEVMNQVQLDVTMYRNKAKSSYQSASSNIPLTYSETPTLNKNRPSFSQYEKPKDIVDSQYIPNQSPSLYNSLKYSKTPELTQRVSDRVSEKPIIQQPQNVQQAQNPSTIVFKGKKFFLN